MTHLQCHQSIVFFAAAASWSRTGTMRSSQASTRTGPLLRHSVRRPQAAQRERAERTSPIMSPRAHNQGSSAASGLDKLSFCAPIFHSSRSLFVCARANTCLHTQPRNSLGPALKWAACLPAALGQSNQRRIGQTRARLIYRAHVPPAEEQTHARRLSFRQLAYYNHFPLEPNERARHGSPPTPVERRQWSVRRST